MKSTPISLLEGLCSTGHDELWREIVEIYSPFIENHLRRLGLQSDLLEDVRQDVMSMVVRELPQFEHNGRKGAFRAWLRLITVNRLRSFRRKHANRIRVIGGMEFFRVANGLTDADSDISREWDQQHNRYVIQILMRRVSKRFRSKTMTAFHAVVLQQQPVEQVAEQLGMTVNAVRIAQARVLRALRDVGAGMID